MTTWLRALAGGAALVLLACHPAPGKRQPAPSPSSRTRPASSQANTPARPGRKLALQLSADTFEEAWQAVEAALAESSAPIDSLDIDAFGTPFGDAGVQRLLERRPQLAPLQLTLSNAKLTPAGLSALLDSKLPSRLQLLDLRDNLLGAPGARLLAESTRLASLRQLNLGRNHLHARGAEALAASRGLTSLVRLELEYNFIGYDGARALVQSTTLPNLRDLGLAYNYLGDSGAQLLASKPWPVLEALELLNLGSNEIGLSGARALGAKEFAPGAFVWFGENLDSVQLERLQLQQRLRVEGFPDIPERATLGETDAFDRPRRPTRLTVAAPPEDLPANVDFRELWIWEFGLVAEFPTFMLPGRRPGNGKSRSFSWLDRATLSIGGYWLLPGETFDEALASFREAEPSEQLQLERRNARTAILRSSQGAQKRVARVQSASGALCYVDFRYPAELDAYFAPTVARVINSLYFDRRHLKP